MGCKQPDLVPADRSDLAGYLEWVDLLELVDCLESSEVQIVG